MKFTAVVRSSGKTATGIEVTPEVVASLGPGKRYAITVTINEYSYRSSVSWYRGAFMIPLSAENRAAAGVDAGDEIEVDIELDDQPREVDVPSDISSAIDATPNAREYFDGLSYSNKRRLVLAIDSAKTAETRERRITSTVSALAAGTA